VKTLLFIFAHPDDESFSGAGTAMKYGAAGARTVLVTATLGERGKTGDPPVCTVADLPACRERELREASRIIGFDELHLLGYRDRELAGAPPDEIRRALVSLIRRVKPSVVFTFDPNGFNAHPDHVAISRFTSDAIAAAADPRWYPDVAGSRDEAPPWSTDAAESRDQKSYGVPRLLWTPPVAPWDEVARRPDNEPGTDFVIDVTPWLDRRVAALRAHRSQHLSIDRLFFDRPEVDRILQSEIWRQAWGPKIDGERPARDIFRSL
jgi:LmbE family N-acetylglucosaminyl deacetylase